MSLGLQVLAEAHIHQCTSPSITKDRQYLTGTNRKAVLEVDRPRQMPSKGNTYVEN